MKLLVGLGNPGKEYTKTRHNVGFDAIEKIAQKLLTDPKWQSSAKLQGHYIKTPELVFLKPTTYMNLSGIAVQKLASLYKIAPHDIWVFHDEMDIELGKIKIQIGGGSAGHNGIKSLIADLGTNEFVRWRIGIGKSEALEGADYVLSKFTKTEEENIEKIIETVVESTEFALRNNLIASMNKYN
jgi:PTH1 family peptidyl-tRNA hydrolase